MRIWEEKSSTLAYSDMNRTTPRMTHEVSVSQHRSMETILHGPCAPCPLCETALLTNLLRTLVNDFTQIPNTANLASILLFQ